MSKLPHRFSESAFRKYERTIARITEKFPSVVIINPGNFQLSPETVRGRLRDACSSHATHMWQSDLIDWPKFKSINQSDLVISIRPDGMVIAGTKATIKAANESVPELDLIPDKEILNLEAVNFPMPAGALRMLATLAHHGALAKQLKLRVSLVEVDILSNELDISIVPTTEPNIYLLS